MTGGPSTSAGNPAARGAGNGGGSGVVRSVVCTRCGCGCDDIDLTVSEGRVVEARNACDLGRPWFLTPLDEEGPPARVDGRPASVQEGATAAAELLRGARRPLVWGLLHLSCGAQRLAVRIAERVRGVIDPAAGPNHPAAVTAFAEWGEVSTTLGEVAIQRGLVVLWLAEPERSHPRLLERWGIDPGDGERLIRLRRGEPGEDGWTVPAGRELEFLWALRELARARAKRKPDERKEGAAEAGTRGGDGSGEDDGRAQGATGAGRGGSAVTGDRVPAPNGGGDVRALAERLLERLTAARYAILAFEAAAADPALQHALRALAATLNGVTRFRLFPLRPGGNRLGAEAVLTWQTGFPVAVDFASGAPRANGGEFSAARLLARSEIDAALVVCANPADFSAAGLELLAQVPVAVLDSSPNPLAERARAALRSAPYGLASGGTFFRSDGVPLGLRPVLASRYPTEEEWLSRILDNLPAGRSA